MIAFASSLDQAGPLARSAEDCAILLNEMSGHDSKDTTSLDIESTDLLDTINQPIKGLKIGIVKEFDLGDLDSEVQNRFEDSKKLYETLGAEVYRNLTTKYLGISPNILLYRSSRMFVESIKI